MGDYADSRWMPPSPHREAILDVLRHGRAHEEVLYRHRDLAIEIGGLYEDIRGARTWERPRAAEGAER